MTSNDFRCGDIVTPFEGVTLRTATCIHPNHATGYQIESDGRWICYLADAKHFEDTTDWTLVEMGAGANMVIYDCCHTDEKCRRIKGPGHSTWQEGLRLVEAAGTKTLAIFHHDNEFMDEVARQAKPSRSGTIFAREGMTLRP